MTTVGSNFAPEKLFLELEQFKTVIDSHIKKQYKHCDRIKQQHLDRCQRYQEAISSLKQREKDANHAIEVSTKEIERNKRELEKLEISIDKLAEHEQELPSRLDAYEKRAQQLESKLIEKRAEINKKRRIQRVRLDDASNQSKIFESLLGLKLVTLKHGKVQFIFTKIDPKQPDREFSAIIQVDKNVETKVVETNPYLDGLETLDPTKFSLIITTIRSKFKSLISQQSMNQV